MASIQMPEGIVSTSGASPTLAEHHVMDRRRAGPVYLGTSLDTKGGISTVLRSYVRGGFFSDWGVRHVVTHSDRDSKIVKMLRAIWGAFILLGLLLVRRITILHIHTASGPSFWRKLAIGMPVFLCGLPVIMHVHGGGFEKFFLRCGPVRRSVIRWAFRRSRLVLALTEEWATTLARLVPGANVEILANPVEVAEAHDQPMERDVVLFLGLLRHSKGAHDLISAFARVPRSSTPWTLVMAGIGDVDGLRQLASSLNVADRVLFPGWIGDEEKARWFARAACLALPSYAEGLPMAVLESLANGVPVVATAVGGIPRVVIPGVTGVLIQPGDVDDLGRQLSSLLSDRATRAAMGAAGRELVRTHYSLKSVLESLGEKYLQLGMRRAVERRDQADA